MVEKMSADVGNSRASNALHKRHDSIKKWKQSDTAKESSVRHPSKFKIKFDKGTVFLSAVSSGDIEETTRLIKEGVDIDHTNVDGLTALHQACIDENQDMVKLLLEKGANVEARDNEGWSPLHAAASAGNVDIAQILIDNGADLSAVNNEGEIPLDLAEEEDMEEFLSDQIESQGLEVEEARNEEERLMLEDASKWLNNKKLEDVLDWQGATALHVAAAKGYTKVISLLLQLGIDVNVRDNDGWTPLHAAVHWGSKAATELLTDAGGDFELKTNYGQTPCELAEADFLKVAENCRKKSKDLVKKPTVTKNKSPRKADEEKDSKAVDLLGTEPKRSAFKGGRDRTVSQNGPLPASLAPVLLPDDASEARDSMVSSKEPEKASEDSESESGSESDIKEKDERPQSTKNLAPGPPRPGPLRPGQQAAVPATKSVTAAVNPLRPSGLSKPDKPEDAKESKTSSVSRFGARSDSKDSKDLKEDSPPTRLGPARPPTAKEEPVKKDSSVASRPPLRPANSDANEPSKKEEKKTEDVRSRFQNPRLGQRDEKEKEEDAANKRVGKITGKRGETEEPADKMEEPGQPGATGSGGPARPFSLPARPPSKPNAGSAPVAPSSVSKPAGVSDWRLRLAERNRQLSDDSKPEPVAEVGSNETADLGSRSETDESRTATSSGESDEDEEGEDKQGKSQRKRRTLRETRRSTGVAYLPEEDDNESNEPDTKRNTRVNEEIERKRNPSSTEEDASRMSIADRLRKKNQELISSSDRSSDRAKDRPAVPDTPASSGTSIVRDRASRTVITTSSTSTSESADAKELQRKLDQALKEASEYKTKYETVKKEKEDLEKKLEQYKEDIEKMQELKNDNLRLKDENGALIRVISKLSRTPASATS